MNPKEVIINSIAVINKDFFYGCNFLKGTRGKIVSKVDNDAVKMLVTFSPNLLPNEYWVPIKYLTRCNDCEKCHLRFMCCTNNWSEI